MTLSSSPFKTLSCQTHLELLQVQRKTKRGLTSKFQRYFCTSQTFSKTTLYTCIFQWLIISLLTCFSYGLAAGTNFYFSYYKSSVII